MTKVIAVLRHAQSAGKQSAQPDYDRVLTPKGERNARALGKKLLEHPYNVELILSSSAVRARQTVDLANEYLVLSDDRIWFRNELYETLMPGWFDLIHKLPMDIHRVLLVGHNPCVSMIASYFAGTTVDLAPCELLAFEFNVKLWEEIADRGKEILRIKPQHE